jgi:hypothetical protein
MALKLLQSVDLSTQNLLHNIGFGAVILCMLTPKNLSIIIVQLTCIVSLKCKIIFNITSTYITSIIYSNIGFLAGTITLEVACSMIMVALNIRGATDGCGQRRRRFCYYYTLQNRRCTHLQSMRCWWCHRHGRCT